MDAITAREALKQCNRSDWIYKRCGQCRELLDVCRCEWPAEAGFLYLVRSSETGEELVAAEQWLKPLPEQENK